MERPSPHSVRSRGQERCRPSDPSDGSARLPTPPAPLVKRTSVYFDAIQQLEDGERERDAADQKSARRPRGSVISRSASDKASSSNASGSEVDPVAQASGGHSHPMARSMFEIVHRLVSAGNVARKPNDRPTDRPRRDARPTGYLPRIQAAGFKRCLQTVHDTTHERYES